MSTFLIHRGVLERRKSFEIIFRFFLQSFKKSHSQILVFINLAEKIFSIMQQLQPVSYLDQMSSSIKSHKSIGTRGSSPMQIAAAAIQTHFLLNKQRARRPNQSQKKKEEENL
jgi:hypothetical protein